jgi:lipopolysaccharide assembly outer membrane protein LptD (OstA)
MGAGSMHLRNVHAEGHVVVTRSGARLMAQRMDYDPLTHWLVSRGSVDHPATFQSADGTESASADEIDWNTQTWNIRTTNTSVLGKGK